MTCCWCPQAEKLTLRGWGWKRPAWAIRKRASRFDFMGLVLWVCVGYIIRKRASRFAFMDLGLLESFVGAVWGFILFVGLYAKTSC